MLESALLCLALNIFHEARGESVPGQYAVAQVTMNRAGEPKNVCRTVYARWQFSWTMGKARHMDPMKMDPHAWWKAKTIAGVVLRGQMPLDFSRGATHYHAVHVSPSWGRVFERTVRIGNHIFYIGK